MNWEYDSGEDVKDRTKLVWFGIVGGSVLLVGIYWLLIQDTESIHSKARVYQIVISMGHSAEGRSRALELVTDLRQRIIGGKSFSSIAKSYSNHEYTAVRGGDAGWVGKGTLINEVDSYVWSCRLNEVSDVIQTGASYYLVLVTDRHVAEADKYEDELRDRVMSGGAEDGPTPESKP